MRKLYFILILLVSLFTSNVIFSQISYGGRPISEKETLSEEIDHIQLRGPDMDRIRAEDIANEDKGVLRRMGEGIFVDIDMENSGTWEQLSDGTNVWRLKISSKNALALGLYFDDFKLPVGSQLFVYSPDRVQTLGAYNENNNTDGGSFAIELVYGESLIIEYIAPKLRAVEGIDREFKNTAKLHIDCINYAYRDVVDYYRNSKDFGDSESCQVNINCPEGNNWQEQKKGVARILIDAGGGYIGWCTGTLINNTNQDGTPYFLSAWHCKDGAPTSQFGSWIFYFNYEHSGCSNTGIQPSSNTITGMSVVADASLNGGSDLLLMRLNSTPPAYYNVVYNGWDRTTSASPSGVGIHHPSGDVKKISTYTSPLSSATYNGGPGSMGASGAHWRVVWSGTQSGHGVTEGGSSGSPIFNNNGLVVGSLSGGSSYCDATSSPDLYGKFSYHWVSNGSSSSEQLEPWLDPANTGATTCPMYDPNNAGLSASFTANTTSVSEGGTVNFTSTSTGGATSYSWSFPGGTPSSSTAQNPSVTYNTAGTYNVSLTVSNGSENDTHTKNNYITVTAGGSVEDCTTLNNPLPGTPISYVASYQGEYFGYVMGNNNYEDIAKVNYYTHSGVGYITKLSFDVFKASGTSSNMKLVVYSSNSGSPGTLLGSKTVSMSSITDSFNQEGQNYEYTFDSPIQVNGNFFAGIELPASPDTLALLSNTDGDTNPGIAWEQWSDNTWQPLSSDDSFNLNVAIAIYPEVCQTLSNIDIAKGIDNISVYPNPTNSILTVEADEIMKEANVKIYNHLGKLIYETNKTNSKTIKLDMSQYSDGLYIIRLENENGIYRDKIQLTK